MRAQTLQEALTSGRGVERSFRCEVHDDRHASASVNSLTGLWVCYACGAAGKADENATIPDADTLLSYLKGDIPVRVYAESWLDLYDADHPSKYWAARFGQNTADHYRCGTHPLTGQPTYPIRNFVGDVLGVVVRQEGNPKYLYPAGVSTSRTFFGDIRPASVIVLVEGAADVMALHQAGIPDRWTVLGCYGAGVHAPQVDLLASFNPHTIVLAFDNDPAGVAAAERSHDALIGIAPVIVTHSWGAYNDPGDVPVEDRITSITNTIAKEHS